MEKTKIIKKEDLEFDPSKIKTVSRVDVFSDRVEIVFVLED